MEILSRFGTIATIFAFSIVIHISQVQGTVTGQESDPRKIELEQEQPEQPEVSPQTAPVRPASRSALPGDDEPPR